MGSPEWWCSRFDHDSVPLYPTTKNGADESASCTIRLLLTTMQLWQLHFSWFVVVFRHAQNLCANILGGRNIPDMFIIGCQRVFLIVAADVLRKKKKLGVFYSCAYMFVKLSNEIYIRDLVLLIIYPRAVTCKYYRFPLVH